MEVEDCDGRSFNEGVSTDVETLIEWFPLVQPLLKGLWRSRGWSGWLEVERIKVGSRLSKQRGQNQKSKDKILSMKGAGTVRQHMFRRMTFLCSAFAMLEGLTLGPCL